MLRSFYMLAGLTLFAGPAAALPAHPPLHKVASLKITVLSTMLADRIRSATTERRRAS
jgi:hypothetical protein